MATSATTGCDGEEYYDFLLVGRTGMGKSTLGNKLLRLEVTDQSKIRQFSSVVHTLLKGAASGVKRFLTAKDASARQSVSSSAHVPPVAIESVTRKCELLANDKFKMRVLDVPGFADTAGTLDGHRISAYDGNLQIIRWIVRVQVEKNLRVRRVVYFLPIRGILEKADRVMQEELQVMHHFFGSAIFNCMVVVATNHPRKKHQDLGYDQEDLEQTKEVFHEALRKIFKRARERVKCPPIVYIGADDSEEKVIDDIKMKAAVLKDVPLTLKFTDDVCSRCSVKIRKLDHQKDLVLGVVNDAGAIIPYKESKCHPCFLPRYTEDQKFWGGVGHIATLGIGLAVERVIPGIESWPGFTNSDEICPNCHKFPGSTGCCKVKQTVNFKDLNPTSPDVQVLVDHTNKL